MEGRRSRRFEEAMGETDLQNGRSPSWIRVLQLALRTIHIMAMALLLGGLLLFSVWLPAPLLELLHQAAAIIGGTP